VRPDFNGTKLYAALEQNHIYAAVELAKKVSCRSFERPISCWRGGRMGAAVRLAMTSSPESPLHDATMRQLIDGQIGDAVRIEYYHRPRFA
jgi:hypothetical protein